MDEGCTAGNRQPTCGPAGLLLLNCRILRRHNTQSRGPSSGQRGLLQAASQEPHFPAVPEPSHHGNDATLQNFHISSLPGAES